MQYVAYIIWFGLYNILDRLHQAADPGEAEEQKAGMDGQTGGEYGTGEGGAVGL